MKRCPHCNRTYDDDTLSYCLEDGTRLISGYDTDATQINPFPPASPTAPTVAYQAPTIPAPGPPAPPAPPPVAHEPAPRKRPLLAIVAVLIALVIGIGIGGLMFQRYSSPSSAATPTASPTPSSVVAATATPRPTAPTPAPATTPTPAAPTPTPSPMATPSRSVVQSTPEPKPDCVLYNDMADRSGVKVRSDCDTRDCDNDSSTIKSEYPDNTPVRVVKGANVRGARFTWAKVIIIASGETFWVASTKIRCN